ncbi:SprT-like domain-containing protein [Azospirillum palustre]
MTAITAEQYAALQRAFDHFNATLFGGTLPQVLITFQRSKRFKGYFSPERFESLAASGERRHEIALNPDVFDRDQAEILSTLVHEMVHVWQEEFGKRSRGGYHNMEWAAKMKAVGLHPSDTGAPGGKETGQRMTHIIVTEGPFDREAAKLLADGIAIAWKSDVRKAGAAKKDKVAYACGCGTKVWGKPGLRVICGDCVELLASVAAQQGDGVELTQPRGAG